MPLEKVGVQATVDGVDAYVRNSGRVSKSNADMGKSAAAAGGMFDMAGRSSIKLGAAIGSAAAVVQTAIGGALQVITKLEEGTVGAAISFESSFAGIRKTVDLTEAGYEQLIKANRTLAKEMPVSVEAINHIGELGGQLGIRGIANLVEFETTIAQISVTTNLTAEDAALAFAQIANVIQLPQDKIDNLASAIVGLGNNFATTESKIVDFVQRIGGAAQIAGLTPGDIAGIAAAFSSLGIEAEAGGTAVQKVLIDMNTAVASGGDELKLFAATAGLSAQQFADLWKKDAGQAFRLFVEGLGRSGDDSVAILAKLGLEDQRLLRSFLAAAGAGDLLSRAMAKGNEEFAAGNALQIEAAKRFDTTESKIAIMSNNFRDLGISIGLTALPAIVSISEKAVDLAGVIDQLRERTELLKLAFLVLAETVGFALFGPTGALVVGLAVMTQFDIDWKQLWQDLPGPVQDAVIGIAEWIDNLDNTLTEFVQNWTLSIGFIGREVRRAAAFTRASMAQEAGDFKGAAEAFAEAKKIGEEPIESPFFKGYHADRADQLRQDKLFGDQQRKFMRENQAAYDALQRKISGGGTAGPSGPVAGAAPNVAGLLGAGDDKAKKAAEAAAKKLHDENVAALDDLNELIMQAIKERAGAERDATMRVIDQRRTSEEAIHSARMKQIDQEADAARRAIEHRRDQELANIYAVRDAQVASLQGQLNALDAQAAGATQADLQRQVALAFDPQERARAEKELADFNRRAQEDQIRAQIDNVNMAADSQAEAARARADEAIQLAQDQADQQREIEQAKFDAIDEMLKLAVEGANNAYEQMTADYRVQAEARALIEQGHQNAIVELIGSFAKNWAAKGATLGAALIDGIKSSGIEQYIAGVLARIPTRGGGGGVVPDAPAGYADGGYVTRARAIPQVFAGGGTVADRAGAVPVWAHPGEIILNRAQQLSIAGQLGSGIVIERGAFDGMFQGAQFGSDAAETGRIIRREMESLLEHQLGREAHLHGV